MWDISLRRQAEHLSPLAYRTIEAGCVQPECAAQANIEGLDIDATIDRYCVETGVTKPEEIERLLQMHLEVLEHL